jgi:hypothetical protein
MNGYLCQPRGKGRPAREISQVLISAQVGLLDNILGFGVVSNNAARHAKQALIVSSQYELKRNDISFHHPLNDFLVGDLFRLGAIG